MCNVKLNCNDVRMYVSTIKDEEALPYQNLKNLSWIWLICVNKGTKCTAFEPCEAIFDFSVYKKLTAIT